ncbi:flagellar protein FlgN [Paenibacillus sp. V4I5]|uniref:flagellar protein FlgN n=1 Tax=Paenibacillus sp. V4I5 TaxID=3042306 RepID=UPI002792E9BF|nr:flagellar protein FlgN [Paenibacillus sp. V4I5]MDQ0918575.1 flagellar biosynthesis/type III secretory pathway chaperone [Paenibacillus sp. V4I5]
MSIQPLLETMDKLQEAHEALLELAKGKTQVLVSNDIDQLNMIVNRENKWVRAIAEANQQRIQIIGSYLISRGYNPNPKITVNDLIKVIFNAQEKQALSQAQQLLLTTIKELKECNIINQQLIEQSLSFINYSIDLVLGAPEDDVVYQNPHQQANGPKRLGVFDTKA